MKQLAVSTDANMWYWIKVDFAQPTLTISLRASPLSPSCPSHEDLYIPSPAKTKIVEEHGDRMRMDTGGHGDNMGASFCVESQSAPSQMCGLVATAAMRPSDTMRSSGAS